MEELVSSKPPAAGVGEKEPEGHIPGGTNVAYSTQYPSVSEVYYSNTEESWGLRMRVGWSRDMWSRRLRSV